MARVLLTTEAAFDSSSWHLFCFLWHYTLLTFFLLLWLFLCHLSLEFFFQWILKCGHSSRVIFLGSLFTLHSFLGHLLSKPKVSNIMTVLNFSSIAQTLSSRIIYQTTASVCTSHKHLNLTCPKLNSRSTLLFKTEEAQRRTLPSIQYYKPELCDYTWISLLFSLSQPIRCQIPFSIFDLLSLKHISISSATIPSNLYHLLPKSLP